ncbi:MAG: DOMON-like domain-containing protein [Leptolyngbyaceae cyanobacterium RU_5_1]|nr:DOMON-like domain-containing protein [Leptolyngbyaceae cyanobacterium RU_5_1]
MTDQHFSLQPFPSSEPPPDLNITGSITRQSNRLVICYALLSELADVVIAGPSDSPTRQHNLWEDTCFEFFVAIQGRDRYWEFNLSPAGHWNVYRFDGYRQGMQEELAFTMLPFSVQLQPNVLSLVLDLSLDGIASAEQILEVAIATVIKTKDSGVTYWALSHCEPQADFHRRDSFTIAV